MTQPEKLTDGGYLNQFKFDKEESALKVVKEKQVLISKRTMENILHKNDR